MKDRGVTATLFLDIEGHASGGQDPDTYAVHRIDAFHQSNGPFGPPHPTIYYDPRTARAGPPSVSLHAKCVVIDRRKALLTSANFTDRGQTRNIEAGVLVTDRDFASELVQHWTALVNAGVMRRYTG